MRLTIEHRTAYRFSMPQRRLIQLLRVTPPSFEGQAVLDWRIDVDCDARLKNHRDGYGNDTTMLYVEGPIETIQLVVTGEVLTDDRAGMVVGAPEPLPTHLFLRATPQTMPDDAITAFAREIAADVPDPLGRLHIVNAALNRRIAFDPGNGNPHRDAAETFADGRGVCQDHAHVFIAMARLLGQPARYVSGHLFRTDGAHGTQPAAHAWAEAYVDDYGWIAFDPANGICPTDAYVRIAVGLDYRDASPVSGARVGRGTEALHVEVAVAQSRSARQD